MRPSEKADQYLRSLRELNHRDLSARVVSRKARVTICKIAGCEKPCEGHGLCQMHLVRVRRAGWLADLIEAKCMRQYGLSCSELDRIKREHPDAVKAYQSQRRKAERQRGITWRLTFKDWWSLWLESGKWHSRGRYKGQYCMARREDSGAYEVGNVRICSKKENNQEYQLVTRLRRRALFFASRVAETLKDSGTCPSSNVPSTHTGATEMAQ